MIKIQQNQCLYRYKWILALSSTSILYTKAKKKIVIFHYNLKKFWITAYWRRFQNGNKNFYLSIQKLNSEII
ncbi:unnamed protein product [Blepharisma stoltei]|uniref:Uncharacterized protein n=1 Tax=Blepharisma stoltei TaxID=1481888 RepID=A0AAU9K7Z3_9CILI|nr:unnamed protein product [Blepharisma stoltei]